MAKPIPILLRMAESDQPHMENIRFMVLMVDDHISMSMPELNDQPPPPVTYLGDNKYEEGLGD